MNDIINKIITIASIETKLTANGKTMLKLGDTENKHYQIWQKKQDGTDSVAYQRLQELGEPVGKTVEIGYKEDQGDYNGKPITYKTIINIKPANGRTPTKSDLFVKSQMREEAKENDGKKWEEISRGKVRHGVACEFIRLGAEYNLETINKINKWTAFIMTGEMFAKEDVPTIQLEELGEVIKESDIDPNNIPF